MNYKFSKKSNDNLKSCHPKLQKLFNEVIKYIDCTILCGHRGEEAQNKAFRNGFSKLQYPDGKHNKMPSEAVDVAPYPIQWESTKRFYFFAGVVKAIAGRLDIKIRWGGDWDGDMDFSDQTLNDLVHFELIE